MYDIPNPNRLRIQKSEKEGFTDQLNHSGAPSSPPLSQGDVIISWVQNKRPTVKFLDNKRYIMTIHKIRMDR